MAIFNSSILNTVYLDMALFAFILFGTPSGSWAWKSISPPRFWKFSAIMSSDMLSSPFHLSSLYGTSIMWILMHVMLYQRPLKMSSVFKILFLLFQWFLLIFYNSNDSSLTQLHSNKSLKNKWKTSNYSLLIHYSKLSEHIYDHYLKLFIW